MVPSSTQAVENSTEETTAVLASILQDLVHFLQVEVQPPVPSLRITCFIILFSLPVLLLAHTAPRWLLARWRRRRRAQGSRPSTDAAQPGATGPSEGVQPAPTNLHAGPKIAESSVAAMDCWVALQVQRWAPLQAAPKLA